MYLVRLARVPSGKMFKRYVLIPTLLVTDSWYSPNSSLVLTVNLMTHWKPLVSTLSSNTGRLTLTAVMSDEYSIIFPTRVALCLEIVTLGVVHENISTNTNVWFPSCAAFVTTLFSISNVGGAGTRNMVYGGDKIYPRSKRVTSPHHVYSYLKKKKILIPFYSVKRLAICTGRCLKPEQFWRFFENNFIICEQLYVRFWTNNVWSKFYLIS